uniref:SAM domain-containing protein n=2 Tax=Timema TaxID=61471 RepID=A0A7R8VPJ9_TIMDO|nr:unnamed protein product [Timema douglasi]
MNVSTFPGGGELAGVKLQPTMTPVSIQQQSAGTRMLPVLYIQGPSSTMRVGGSGSTNTVARSATGAQVISTLRPTIMSTNATHQFLPIGSKLVSSSIATSVPTSTITGTVKPLVSQPHIVIQRPVNQTSSSGPTTAITKHTFAYLGTLLKPGMTKSGESSQLVLPNGQLPSKIIPAPSQKLVLTPMLPQRTPTPASTITTGSHQNKVTSLLVPVSLSSQTAASKNIINLKISNGQITTAEGKTAVTVLREAKPLTATMGQVPPLQPISKFPAAQKLTCLKSNGQLLPESTTLTPVREVSHLVPIAPKPTTVEDDSGKKSVACNTVSAEQSLESAPRRKSTEKVDEEKNTLNQELNRCLQEAVEAIFFDSPPASVKPESIPLSEDDVTLIKVVSTEEATTEKKVDTTDLPEDDVKIEIVKPKEDPNTPFDSLKVNTDDFDPIKVLDWKDGIGALPGSNLKFRMNEFGLMEMVEDEDYEKMLSDKSSSVTPGSGDNGGVKRVSQEVKEDKKETPKSADTDKPAISMKSHNAQDEMYHCDGCGVYGHPTEFYTPRFCNHGCQLTYASRRAALIKKQRDLLQLRLRRRKKRLYDMVKQQELQRQKQEQQRLQQQQLQLQMSSTGVNTAAPVQSSPATSGSKTSSYSEDENTSNDMTQSQPKMPWQVGKSGFSWCKYLDHCKAKGAPVKLFKDPFPYLKNGFKVGMKMEGIDPDHPSFFCVLSVADVQGYRMRLHFDGYPDNHDFWVNADSMDIFPAGWCEKNNHKLQPPKGYMPSSFNWGSYLKMSRSQAAPRNLFANKTGSSICPNAFRLGMKLEAVDRKNSSMVCVATVSDLIDSRILVHFDSWDKMYDYWADPTSPYIHPVGWCKEHGHKLTPPHTYKSSNEFSWDIHLRESKSSAAPARAFKQRPSSGFRRGMRLECVDPWVTSLIRVSTVEDVKNHQVKIRFDGWPKEYSFWVDDDSPDIHPIGWCQKTGHVLEPPLVPEDAPDSIGCPTPGCRGVGHIKGHKYSSHNNTLNCPYAPQNLNKDNMVPDRLIGKPENYECLTDQSEQEKSIKLEGSSNLAGRPQEGRNPVGRPPKWRRIDTSSETKLPMVLDNVEIKNEDDEKDRKRKKRRIEEEDSSSESKPLALSNDVQHELHEAVWEPGYEPNPDSNLPSFWVKHSIYLSDCTKQVASLGNPVSWSEAEVARFVASIPGCEGKARTFLTQLIDGEAFLMMAQNDLVQLIGLKLGPAIKLYNSIVLLRYKWSEK